MENHFKKVIFRGAGVFIAAFFLVYGSFSFFSDKFFSPANFPKMAAVIEENIPVEIKANIKLAFVGDTMLDRGVKSSVYKNFSGDYSQLFAKVKDQLIAYDVLFANLEGPISVNGEDVGGIYSFRLEPQVATALKDSGFGIFSVANNHIFNYGRTAFVDTLNILSDAGLSYAGGGFDGVEAYGGKIMNVNGVRIAYLAFSEFPAGGIISSSTNSGMAIISEKNVQESVSRARQNADLVIVSYHFGDEYETLPNDYQRKYSELAIDAGADLVVGHHPHVVEALEQYKSVYIIYSLGNFIFDQNFSPETMSGGLLEVEVNPDSKKIEKVTLKKVLLNKMFQVESIE